MMAVNIKAVQDKARHAIGNKRNIIERTALWYRLERIGQERSEIETHTPKTELRMRTYLSIDKKALELQKRVVSLEEEIKLLRKSKKKKDVYSIT